MEESLRNTSLWMFTQFQHSSFKFSKLIFFIKTKNFNCKPNCVFIPHKIWEMSTIDIGKSITKFKVQNYFQHNSFSNMTSQHFVTEQRINNWNILIQIINCKVILPVYKRHFTFKNEHSFLIFWIFIWLILYIIQFSSCMKTENWYVASYYRMESLTVNVYFNHVASATVKDHFSHTLNITVSTALLNILTWRCKWELKYSSTHIPNPHTSWRWLWRALVSTVMNFRVR